MSLHYVKPKSDVRYFPTPRPHKKPPENNLWNIEQRVLFGKGDTYRLLEFPKDIKAMV